MLFKVHVCRLKTNPKRALKVFNSAIKCIEGTQPKSGKECGLCEYVGERKSQNEFGGFGIVGEINP